MCRWLAYSGPPIRVGAVLVDSRHSLIRQSMAAREGVTPVNGDGFGLGWYAHGEVDPRRYRVIQPAWSDGNLLELASLLEARALLAHVRASSGAPVQQTNCHPFRSGRWLFVHNGELLGFDLYRRELLGLLPDAQFDEVEGSTDSEVLFQLALALGLADDPRGGLERAIGTVEQVAAAHGVVGEVVQATIGVTDGRDLHALRYASAGVPRTLYHTTHAFAINELVPFHPELAEVGSAVGLVVSEPITDLPGEWVAVPPSSFLTLVDGEAHVEPFYPAAT